MKWAFAIQRKLRLAIVLAVLMLFIIIFSLIESYNINRISKSFNSIYEDRLIPAVDLHLTADLIHKKQSDLVTFLFAGTPGAEQIKVSTGKSNSSLDSLLNKYGKTHLVAAETSHLQSLKKNLKDYQRDELMIINTALLNKDVAQKLYLTNTLPLYEKLNTDLLQLTHVQSQVGKELLTESLKSQASSNFITQLQLAVTVILGLVIMILIVTGKQVMISQEKYKMN
ncbi:hypothetical protein GZH53_01400 [Flavihumibacter sp. R14]|nr:hypothetical protein [Flavihumibacter soli]